MTKNSGMFDLTGRVALVSGAASGLGKATALAVAEAGADVVLADIDEDGMRTVAGEIESLDRRALPQVCDISEPAQICSMFERIDDEFGRIDFVANIAGEAVRKKPEDISLDEVEWTWRNLVYGRFCCCQQAGRRMLAAGKGSIVNLGSLASVAAMGRGHIAYSMAMGAVVQMTRELSTEWSGRGVRVNSILPAQVLNPGLRARIDADPRIRDRFLSGLPAGRFGTPEDIKGLAVFLASDASSWITGALIPMDGGNLAMNAGGSVGSEVFKRVEP
ncbi:MAG: SDR family NAD(P)-dependent oxidoreductase [Bryobacterales bacterium]|nr:SDR family NAD(P)-dependent oxidoreductase [Bryobacterales bacterium]MDE0296537.1 SDR family NAD(P)-dependent oxidoreductase [Bryobacterales bacterium]